MKFEWKEVCLGEITRWSSGGTPSKNNPLYWNGTIPWISAKNMPDGWLDDAEPKITELGLNNGSRLAPPNSILMLVRGSGLYNRRYICITNNPVAFNQDVKCIETTNNVLPEFIYYWLRGNDSTLVSLLESTGIGAGKFDVSRLQKLHIMLPPLHEQEKLVSIARSLDDKIALNNKLNDNLEQQVEALFKAWFIDNPDSSMWSLGTFSDLLEKTISGDWGKDAPTGNNTEMVYCVRGADIPEVRAGNKGKMPTRYIPPKNFSAKRLVDGDIVVEISGGSPTQSTGRAAAITESLLNRYDKGMVCTNFCKALKPKKGYSMYIYYYWQYLYNMGVFFSYENGTTGIKNLDIASFIEMEPIVIPPAEMLAKFDKFCKAVFSKIYANGYENERLANIRDVLLPKLMSGEIDVTSTEVS